MALASVFTAAIVLAAAPILSGQADWLAQARAGQLACAAPNVARKTCASLARYNLTDNGKVEEAAETLILIQPPLTFKTRKVYEIRGGQHAGP